MTYLSILEKFKILFNTLLDFKFILIFTILISLLTFLYIIKKISSRKYMLCVALSFAVIFGISIFSNYEVLSNTFDNFTTIFFRNIYFPSIYVYVLVLAISFIAFITSVLNMMLKKVYKIINSIIFVINNVLFVIILNIVAKNKIDVFSVNSLYTDASLVAILELSMNLFILWILSLIIIYTTNCICEKLIYKKIHNTKISETFNPILEVSNDVVTNPVLVKTISTNKELINEINPVVEEIINTDENNVNEDIVTIEQNSIEEINDIVTNPVLVETISTNKELINEINPVVEEIINTDENNIARDVGIEEKNVTEESQIMDSSVEPVITFNDILNENISVTYYDNNVCEEEYNLIDPQTVYEDKYNKIKSENIETFSDENIKELSVEEKTLKEKERVKEERLIQNTISLNDLIKEDINELEAITNENNYTIDDYKKIIEMLNNVKAYSNMTNINIDDAVAISLISNYSIDDCIKFKDILESNLN